MSQDLITAAPAVTQRVPVRRAVYRWLVGGAVLLVGYALLPWEWSFIDDPRLVDTLHAEQHAHGWLPGTVAAIGSAYRFDATWGLFRPSWWVYAGVFYLLPAGPAHAVRLAMYAAALAGPLALLARGRTGRFRWALLGWGAAVVLANGSLYRGLWFTSLQELSGLCFVGLGLPTRRRWLRVLLWLVAAWFKSPFGWLLVGYGALLLFRRGSRGTGAVSAALGAGTLATAAVYARSGSYTAALSFTPAHVATNARTAALALLPVAGVLLAGALALRTRPARAMFAGVEGPALLLGGAGYVANLLPWDTGAHYAGAYVYLIGVGAALTLAPAARPVTGEGRRWAAAGLLAVALALSVAVLASGGRYVWQNAATTTGLRDCVLGLPDGVLVGYNRPEGWDRLNAIVHEHRPGSRTEVILFRNGSLVGVSNTETFHRADYYIWEPAYGPGTPTLRAGPTVCRTPLATLYRVPAR
jgi:hypothetical protein